MTRDLFTPRAALTGVVLVLAGFWLSGCVRVATPATVAAMRARCVGGELRACDALVAEVPESEALRTEVTAVVTLGSACETGYGLACTELGRRLRAGVAGEPGAPQRAAAQFAKGCHAGEPSACAELGLAFYNGEGVAEHAAYGLAMMESACAGDAAVGCYYVALVEAQEGGSEARASELAARGCHLGHAPSCVESGTRWLRGLGVARDLWRGANAFARACDARHAEGCVRLAAMYALGRGVPLDERNAERLYGEACALGAQEGCVAQVLAGRAAEPARVREQLVQMCDGGGGGACTVLGLAGGGASWLARGCALGDRTGCAWQAEARLETARAPAVSELELLCEEGSAASPLACALLGDALRGSDEARGLALLTQACDAGSDEGCWRLARGLADRDAPAADDAMFAACELGRGEACRTLAEREADAPARAAELHELACRARSAESCRDEGLARLWGRGIELDTERAAEALDRACALGDEVGCAELARLEAVGTRSEVRVLDAGAAEGAATLAWGPAGDAPLELTVVLGARHEALAAGAEAALESAARAQATLRTGARGDGAERLALTGLQLEGESAARAALEVYLGELHALSLAEDAVSVVHDAQGERGGLAPAGLSLPAWPAGALGAGAVLERVVVDVRADGRVESRRERWTLSAIDARRGRVQCRLELDGRVAALPWHAGEAWRASASGMLELELDLRRAWLLEGRGALVIDELGPGRATRALELELELRGALAEGSTAAAPALTGAVTTME